MNARWTLGANGSIFLKIVQNCLLQATSKRSYVHLEQYVHADRISGPLFESMCRVRDRASGARHQVPSIEYQKRNFDLIETVRSVNRAYDITSAASPMHTSQRDSQT